MSREFTRESVTKFLPAKFPWIWCKCLLWNLTHSKNFNLTKYREVLLEFSHLITNTGMPIWIWHQLAEPTLTVNEFNQSLERKRNLSSLVYGLKNTSHQEILCLSRAAMETKYERKAYVIMHVQSGAWHYNHVTFTPIAKNFVIL